MDFATTLKFAHVLAAVLWVGGGFATIVAGIVLAGRSTAQTQLAIVQAVVLLAPRLFIPASIFTLASGVALLFVAGWGWQPFTVLGLAGVLFTAGFGAIVIGPSCERALKLADTHGAEAAIPSLRRVQRLAMMDYAVQFAIVFLMVVKPSWSDFAVFGGIASIIVLAALAALRPIPRATI
ncbi:MAG: DUF2269 family protein [Tabrizicola sp.]|uniref:DUF2269 family protein n=1 Tax=Tabrizicola sp. TaxID=2005166 RepID=UPI00273362BB|nr:DUF2269 family protein [Tabrizicola sp.]MDP3262000.1 DUF2269 family protein [Tabrizicola sp.]